MGHKNSVLKVTSRVTVQGDCGTVDAIRLSYKRRSCWGRRKRVIASFTFPREDWQQLFPENMPRNNSAEVTTIHLGKLKKKDGNTPVRVSCLAGGVPVFKTEMALADLLARLKCTEGGGKAVLSFSLAGRRLKGTGAEGHAFTVLFCNGVRLDNGGAQHLLKPPHQHHTDKKSEPVNGLQKEVSGTHTADCNGSQATPLRQEDAEDKHVSPCLTEDGYGQETDPSLVQGGSPSGQTLLGIPQQIDMERIPFNGDLERGKSHVEGGRSAGLDKEVEDREDDEFLPQTYDDLWQDVASPEINQPRQVVNERRSPRRRGREASKENRSPFLTHHHYCGEEVMDEEDPSLDVDWVQKEPKARKVRHRRKRKSSKSLRSSARRTRDDKILRGQGHVRGALWDRVADCAGVVALVLILYNAWVQYDKYW